MLQNYISEIKSSLKANTELRAQMNSSQMVSILKGNLTSNQSNVRQIQDMVLSDRVKCRICNILLN